jgi:hypothetical protein
MKRFLALFSIAVLAFVYLATAEAKTRLTDEEARKLLLAQIQREKIYGATDSSCLTIFAEGSGSDHVDFSVHLTQGGRCPGNPNASPVVDNFRVTRATRSIEMNGGKDKILKKKPSGGHKRRN